MIGPWDQHREGVIIIKHRNVKGFIYLTLRIMQYEWLRRKHASPFYRKWILNSKTITSRIRWKYWKALKAEREKQGT